MRPSWIVGWALKPMTNTVRDRKRDADTERRGQGDAKAETEVGGMQPRARRAWRQRSWQKRGRALS